MAISQSSERKWTKISSIDREIKDPQLNEKVLLKLLEGRTKKITDCTTEWSMDAHLGMQKGSNAASLVVKKCDTVIQAVY